MAGRIAEASQVIATQASMLEHIGRIVAGADAHVEWADAPVVTIDPLPGTSGQTNKFWFQGLLLAVQLAEPIYVARDPVELISMAASSIPRWPLRHHDLPTVHGFAWFAKAIPIGDEQCIGVIWTSVTHADQDYFTLIRPEEATGVDVYWLKDAVSPVPFMSCFWPFGDAGSPAGVRQDQCFMSLLAFMGQRVLVQERQSGDRASRKLAERQQLAERACIIVTLRRAKAHAPTGDIEAIDWSCRWMVSGHWRQQVFGKGKAEHRPTWIAPYLKGPEDKPIRASPRRVFAVVR